MFEIFAIFLLSLEVTSVSWTNGKHFHKDTKLTFRCNASNLISKFIISVYYDFQIETVAIDRKTE